MPGRKTIRPIALAGSGLAVLLPGSWGTIVVAAFLGLWLALRPPRRSLLLVLPLAVSALVLLAGDELAGSRLTRATPQRAAEHLSSLLGQLDREAQAAAEQILESPYNWQDRARAFEELGELVTVSALEDEETARTWFLFDPNGEAVAWAGRGLVHDIDGSAMPKTGRAHIGSFTANTFLSVVSLDDSRRPWRVAVGLSLPSDLLPGSDGRRAQWAIVGPEVIASGGSVIAQAGDLRVAVRAGGLDDESLSVSTRRPWAAVLLATALVFVALRRWTANGRVESGALLLALVSGVTAVLGWSLTPWIMAPFTVGVLLAMRAVHPSTVDKAQSGWPALFTWSSIVTGLCLLASALLQRTAVTFDLARSFSGNAESVGLRLALFALAFGLLRAAARSGGESVAMADSWRALLAALLLATAAAVHGWPVAGIAFLLAGVALAVSWSRRGGWSDGASGAVAGCVLSALIAAVAWEIAYHQSLDVRLQRFVDAELAPPTATETLAVAGAAREFFDSQPLEDLTVDDPEALDPQDLAFALWRRSPLVRTGRLSRVSVGAVDAPLSTFAYGLPTFADDGGEQAAAVWSDPTLPGWEDATITGDGRLTLGGGMWTQIEYEILLTPGFRDGGSLLPRLAEGLLQGRARPWPALGDLADDLLLGLYSSDGSVIIPPWKGAADLRSESVPELMEIPGGRARTFVAAGPASRRVAFLPVPSPLTGLERVTTHAAGPLVLILVVSAVWFLLMSVEREHRNALRSSWRSFSTRLIVLYSVLLLVPIILLNVLVLRVFAERLEREQRAAGEAALESAQSILGDYVFSLEPGFGIDTAVGDDVLRWLSTVVHQDVNLYWGSRLSASSKRELFASSLLPQRIPGEIFARIGLEGSALASRTTRAGGAVYEEFYAPLEAPGSTTNNAGLFISTPLLAQEVASAEEMGVARRRILLAGGAVALLLALLGRQAARSFTRPLLQIVEGTQAIAAGAPTISVDADDSEFVTLVEAIDEMAARIAAARAELLREKEVVDRMIDNITSGVISVDRNGCVLLLNRTAQALLGISIGEPLAEALLRDELLGQVASFVSSAGAATRQKTVKLPVEGGDEAEWTLLWVPLEGSGEPAALFVLEDVTEVLRGQRLQAWAEMARMIAHEVKNPLTPIRLSTEHLREVHRTRRGDLDAALERCTFNILRQVEELQQIVSDFSAYSRIPEIEPKPGDLADLVEEIADGYRSGGPTIEFERSDGPWMAEFDRKLLARAVRNLLENAVRATDDEGRVTVSVRGRDRDLEIAVADNGSGVAPAHLPRIFEPYFSTEDSGTGLGLPIAMRIVEEHGGSISARNRSPQGLEVLISLPRSSGDRAQGREP